jgi:hypothetical protein
VIVVAFVVMSTTSASQNLDHVIAVATRYIEQHLGEDPLQWSEVIDHLKAGGYTDEATLAVTRAVLDLERTDVMSCALEGMRRPRPGDAAPASLDEVAAASCLCSGRAPATTDRAAAGPSGRRSMSSVAVTGTATSTTPCTSG